MFRVGQRVVCVDAESTGKYLPPNTYALPDFGMNGLTKGLIYIIRDAGVELGVKVCRLEEIIRPIDDSYGSEAWFAQERFRPVVECKTDISVFEALLHPTPKEVEFQALVDLIEEVIR